MEKRLTPELKRLKEEFDYLHKKIGELEWENATKLYGKSAMLRSEMDTACIQLENYKENMDILIERIKSEVTKANQAKR